VAKFIKKLLPCTSHRQWHILQIRLLNIIKTITDKKCRCDIKR